MRRIPWWVWVSATPFGLGAWTPIVPGSLLKRRSWIAWGALWSAATVAGWVLAIVNDGGAGGGGLIILGWAGAVATALAIRPSYQQRVVSTFERSVAAAEQRLQDRQDALRLAEKRPKLALELGVGRPDRPGALDAGLVDANNAPAAVLATLPGVDDALAARIVQVREQVGGFDSLLDLGALVELDGDTVERLRDRVVCLPR